MKMKQKSKIIISKQDFKEKPLAINLFLLQIVEKFSLKQRYPLIIKFCNLLLGEI